MSGAAVIVERGPFEMIPHWLLDESVSAQAIRLYLLLRRHGDGDDLSFPGRRRLAAQLGASVSTVDRAKAELVEAGAICERQRLSDNGDWTSNEYHVHWVSDTNCTRLGSPAGDEGCPARDDTSPAGDDTGCPAGDELTHTHIQNSDTLTQTLLLAADAPSDGFAEFWQVYPRKVGKTQAQKAWTRALRTVTPRVIIEGAKRYANDPNREPSFTAHPTTWLNRGGWDDEPLPERHGRQSATRMYVSAAERLHEQSPWEALDDRPALGTSA